MRDSSTVPLKTCSTCRRELLASGVTFSPNSSRKDGWHNECKQCANQRQKVRAQQRRIERLAADPLYRPGHKQCGRCKAIFPATLVHFAKRKRNADGLGNWCLSCHKEYHARYKVQNSPKARSTVGAKFCKTCSSTKDVSEFSANGRTADGLSHACKACNSAQGRAWRKNNPAKHCAKEAKRRALKRGSGGIHSAADVEIKFQLQNRLCYWCQKPLGAIKDRRFHVDHLIPLSKGGSNGPENIVCACPSCNHSKGAKLPHEWIGRLL